MSNVENRLISKILDQGTLTALHRGNASETDFIDCQNVYNFIIDYNRTYEQLPPVETVIRECPNFEYEAEVTDSPQYLIKKLKENRAKLSMFELLQNQAGSKFSSMSPAEFTTWLKAEVDRVADITESIGAKAGVNLAVNGMDRWESYQERKKKMDNILVPTPYKSLTEQMDGGMELGDYIMLMAFTNKGKSWVATHFAVEAWKAGFGVMHYSPEISTKAQSDRFDTMLGQFTNSLLKKSGLAEDKEKLYHNYLKTFSDSNYKDRPYHVKTMEDMGNKGLTIELIEADIIAHPEVKVIIVDGFLLMNHGAGSKTARREKLAETSRKIRLLGARYSVLIFVVHQTTRESEKTARGMETEDELPVLTAPDLLDCAESVDITRDCLTCFTFNSNNQGQAVLKVVKSKSPIVGYTLNLHMDVNHGILTEPEPMDFF